MNGRDTNGIDLSKGWEEHGFPRARRLWHAHCYLEKSEQKKVSDLQKKEQEMLELSLQPIQGYSPYEEIEVDRFPYVLGRQPDCDSQILSPVVSRRHCRFFRRGYQVWIEDLGSRHGTLLNGEPLTEPTELADGDEITLPVVSYRVEIARVPV